VNRHGWRILAVLVVIAGLGVHIGLGYRFGLVVAGIGFVGHLALGVVARWVVRRRAVGSTREPRSHG
jgi:hypothetical protein